MTKQFGTRAAVNSLSFQVEPDEILAILGPSGCGKTTTLRCIAGFVRPDAGEIILAGQTVFGPETDLPAARRSVGVVFQHLALFPHMNVARNIGFGLERKQRRERVSQMLALVGLEGYEKRYPRQLSGGEQQRIALARALAPRPRLLCLDEPFSDLDAELRGQLRGEVRETIKASGTAAIFVTHDQEEALSISDRVAVMKDGEFRQVSDPESLYSKPSDPWVARFVGEGELIPGRVTGNQIRSALGTISLARKDRHQEGCCWLLVRPEWVSVARNQEGVQAIVDKVDFQGSTYRTAVQLDDFEGVSSRAILKLSREEACRPGEKIFLSLKIDSPVLFARMAAR